MPGMTKRYKMGIAKTLARRLIEKYGNEIKSVIVFGELLDDPKARDIDVYVIYDDTVVPPRKAENMASYVRGSSRKISKSLTVQDPLGLSEFWNLTRLANPVIYNVIKTGVAVYDVGVFSPIKNLWKSGAIPFTTEQINKLMEDATQKVSRAKAFLILILAEDLYFAMLDAAQAVLMLMGVEPPAPARTFEVLTKDLVEPGSLSAEYADWLKEMVETRKKIETKEIKQEDITGRLIDMWLDRATRFVEQMSNLRAGVDLRLKVDVINRTYEKMYQLARQLLARLGGSPERDEDVRTVFKEKVMDKKLVSDHYWEYWNKVADLKRLVDDGKTERIAEMNLDEVFGFREGIRSLAWALEKTLESNGTTSEKKQH